MRYSTLVLAVGAVGCVGTESLLPGKTDPLALVMTPDAYASNVQDGLFMFDSPLPESNVPMDAGRARIDALVPRHIAFRKNQFATVHGDNVDVERVEVCDGSLYYLSSPFVRLTDHGPAVNHWLDRRIGAYYLSALCFLATPVGFIAVTAMTRPTEEADFVGGATLYVYPLPTKQATAFSRSAERLAVLAANRSRALVDGVPTFLRSELGSPLWQGAWVFPLDRETPIAQGRVRHIVVGTDHAGNTRFGRLLGGEYEVDIPVNQEVARVRATTSRVAWEEVR